MPKDRFIANVTQTSREVSFIQTHNTALPLAITVSLSELSILIQYNEPILCSTNRKNYHHYIFNAFYLEIEFGALLGHLVFLLLARNLTSFSI